MTRRKLNTLQEAVQWIMDGDVLAISGSMEMSPMALIREVVRAGKRQLHLVCAGAATVNADILIGSGTIRTVEFSHISMGEYGFAPNFRRRFEHGTIRGLEHACPTLAAALQAGAMGIPFLPVRGLLGTDYMRIRPDFREIPNPYDEQESIAIVPAIRPDVALFHGFKADTLGNVVAHPSHNNRLLAQASKVAIASVEQIITPEELRMEQGSYIPAEFLTAVVHAPYGAHPTGCLGYYGVDQGHIHAYMEAAKSEQDFASYLDRCVMQPTDPNQYVRVAATVQREAIRR